MQKLISQLEAELNLLPNINNSVLNALKSGIHKALQLVKEFDPWISANILPPRNTFNGVEQDYSIEVIATDGKNRALSYYNFEIGKWMTNGVMGDFIKWTYLPEIK